jgi:threonine/homoserine/homoserine lactone efflux protein
MDLGLIGAVAMLVIWALLTFVMNHAPGYTHALLIAGVSLLIWRVVKRGGPATPPPPPRR